MDLGVRIVRAREEDAAGICRAHKASITMLCAGHYTPQEIEAWVANRQAEDYLPGLRENLVLVAVARDRIAGFAEMKASEGLILALYVHPGQVRRGIGGTLLSYLENEARQAGRSEILLDATMNSIPFFLNRGYTLLGEGTNMTPSGLPIPCVHMRKNLQPAAG